MSERNRNVIVGLTGILGLVGLGYLIIIFGEVPAWVADTYPLQIHLNDASGIASGTRVRLNGIDVGFVDGVEMKTPSYEGVVIHCRIEADRRIPVTSSPLAVAGLLGGAAQLNIKSRPPTDGSTAEVFLPTDGTATLIGTASSITDTFGEIAGRLEGDLRKQLESFGTVSEKIVQLADQYIILGDQLSGLMEEQDLAAVDAGTAQANIRTVIARADEDLRELKTTLKHLNSFVDEEMRAEVKGAISEVRGLTGDAREKLAILTDRFVSVTDELNKSLQNTNALLEQGRTGEGTVGKLLSDPELYNALVDSAQRLTDTLNELKLLIQKWKAEGLPVKL